MKHIKIIITLLFVSLNLSTYSQEKLEKTKIIELSDSTATIESIYANCLDWVASKFISPINVIQTQDKELGILILRGEFYFKPKKFNDSFEAGPVTYTMKIKIKKGKCKVTITNFIHRAETYENRSMRTVTTSDKHPKFKTKRLTKLWLELKEFCLNKAEKNFLSLTNSLNEKNDDW